MIADESKENELEGGSGSGDDVRWLFGVKGDLVGEISKAVCLLPLLTIFLSLFPEVLLL